MDLRARTGLGVMECKRALAENNNDVEKAIDALRRSSAIKAAKTADRTAAEGVVMAAISTDGDYGVVFELNCETDFVARDTQFVDFTDLICKEALQSQASSAEELMVADLEKQRQALIQKIGENIQLRRLKSIKSGGGRLTFYTHGNNRIAALLSTKEGSDEIAHDVALHITASNPMVVDGADIPEAIIAKERSIYEGQAKDSGKPAEITEKIVSGKIKKFLADSSLLSQPFVKNPDQSVAEFIAPSTMQVIDFVRFELGEGIDVSKMDFAEEVAAQLAKD